MITPPSNAPTTAPDAPIAPQMPSARLRSLFSVKVARTIDSAAGDMNAALRPCSPREITIIVLSCAAPVASDASANAVVPARNTRLRPNRSAARPPRIKNPPYAST